DDTSIFVCEAIYRDVFMQFADNLYYVDIWRKNSEDQASSAYTRYGNLYCNKTIRKCVRDMTLTDIRKACSVCAQDDKICVMLINF
ncbi:MAG: hypothetical protein J6C85_07170, partial [Alphaproteobacteria bacterium]|nr:hypothetical protein [Alphaproteobacteria bacterium]